MKITTTSTTLLAISLLLGPVLLLPPQSTLGQGLPQVGAQTPIAPEELTRDQAGDMVARLSDEEVRELLIRQLDKVATAEEPEDHTTIIERLMIGTQNAEKRIACWY